MGTILEVDWMRQREKRPEEKIVSIVNLFYMDFSFLDKLRLALEYLTYTVYFTVNVQN